MDKDKVKETLNQAFEILVESSADSKSWLSVRTKGINGLCMNELVKYDLLLRLEAACLSLIIEAMKTSQTKKEIKTNG